MEEPLLHDDQPSWVTLANEEAEAGNQHRDAGFREASQIWAQESGVGGVASASRKSSPSAAGGEADLPKIVLFMRLGNLAAAGLLIFGSVGNVTNVFSLSKMVLAGYGICFGLLICCLEINLSFLRHPIASNFGFLYNPFLRMMFYLLMAMVTWTFETILGEISSIVLLTLAVFNTYVMCWYPGYRAALKEVADEEERILRGEMRREARRLTWRHVTRPWWVDDD
mmetsp:Transcript_23932/g.49561  ORF Transcript_23932/g.49561 Transcript_23932/m.49561 type:complete len:225 (+) Transcript_23932:44-718(+)